MKNINAFITEFRKGGQPANYDTTIEDMLVKDSELELVYNAMIDFAANNLKKFAKMPVLKGTSTDAIKRCLTQIDNQLSTITGSGEDKLKFND